MSTHDDHSMKTSPKEFPSWTDHIREMEWDSCIVLIRHEEKEPPKPGGDRQLTENGRDRAFRIGRKLSDMEYSDISFMSSPIQRCVDTASQIAKGMGVDTEVVKHDGLVTIVFNTGVNLNGNADGYQDYVNGIVKEGCDHPMEGTRKMLDVMLPNLKDDGKLTICVSHDLAIAIFNAMVTKRFRSGNWMGFADGVLITRSGDNIELIWEGVTYPLFESLETKAEIDTSP